MNFLSKKLSLIMLFTIAGIDIVGAAKKFEDAQDVRIEDFNGTLRPRYEWQKVEITWSNAPMLNSFINKYLQKFCDKAHVKAPRVCLWFNSDKYENYNFFWNGEFIMLGNGILEILVRNRKFEKYFAALLAHEFSHFRLNHKPASIFGQEIEADSFAFTLIDKPEDLIFAHLFVSLVFTMRQGLESYSTDENKVNLLIAKAMEVFTDLSPDFGSFAQCSCEISVMHLCFEAIIKTSSPLADELASNLAAVSSQSHSMLTRDYLKIWIPRFIEFLKHPLVSASHPSPQYLSSLYKSGKYLEILSRAVKPAWFDGAKALVTATATEETRKKELDKNLLGALNAWIANPANVTAEMVAGLNAVAVKTSPAVVDYLKSLEIIIKLPVVDGINTLAAYKANARAQWKKGNAELDRAFVLITKIELDAVKAAK